MVYTSVFWLNAFPAPDGIFDRIIPCAIVTGAGIDYLKRCRLEFGSYVQVHEEHDNTLVARTTGALALRPTGNAQGGHYFYSLTTGRRLARYSWTSLPMPNEIIQHITHRARADRATVGLEFFNSNLLPYDDPIEPDNPDLSDFFDTIPDLLHDPFQPHPVEIAGVDEPPIQPPIQPPILIQHENADQNADHHQQQVLQ
jgi:Reverse transcriptase (RNA-dependent DNA polymerase)